MNPLNVKEMNLSDNSLACIFKFIPSSLMREWKITVITKKCQSLRLYSTLFNWDYFTLSIFLDQLKSEVYSAFRKIWCSSTMKYPYFYLNTSLADLSSSYHFRVQWCLPKCYLLFLQSLAEGPTSFLPTPVHGVFFPFSNLFISFGTDHLVFSIYFLKRILCLSWA